jgi:hypothetical protein
MNIIEMGSKVQITGRAEYLLIDRCSSKLMTGGIHRVTAISNNKKSFKLDSLKDGWVRSDMLKLAPKWSIYINTLPWKNLSDKQKGKMLLGNHSGVMFTANNVSLSNTRFIAADTVYRAIKPAKLAKPTMETVFSNDWFNECGQSPKNMVAIGWSKS